MKLRELGELALVDRIRGEFAARSARDASVIRGIGDDAAVLMPGRGALLATSDMMAEGVHFDFRLVSPYQTGFKLVAVNVSDIYAMGGEPSHMLLSLAAEGETEEEALDGLFAGVAEGLGRFGVSLVGGDVSESVRGMVLSAALLGYADHPVGRDGARPGDALYVSGPLGEAAAGLEALRRRGRPVDLRLPDGYGPLPWDIMKPLVERHAMPEPDRPPPMARAMMDVSDGLMIDLSRLIRESGVGARVELARVPISDAARRGAEALGLDPMELALSGGEDYRLLYAAPNGAGAPGVRIGEIIESGLYVVDPGGACRPARPAGYAHFGAGA